jgi:hypothetical protein
MFYLTFLVLFYNQRCIEWFVTKALEIKFLSNDYNFGPKLKKRNA